MFQKIKSKSFKIKILKNKFVESQNIQFLFEVPACQQGFISFSLNATSISRVV